MLRFGLTQYRMSIAQSVFHTRLKHLTLNFVPHIGTESVDLFCVFSVTQIPIHKSKSFLNKEASIWKAFVTVVLVQ